MRLEPDQAHSHSKCQAHPIPLYESDNYIYYVEGLPINLKAYLFCFHSSKKECKKVFLKNTSFNGISSKLPNL